MHQPQNESILIEIAAWELNSVRIGLLRLYLRCRFLRSKIYAVGQFAEIVIAMFQTTVADNDDPHARFIAALRHADRAGRHRF